MGASSNAINAINLIKEWSIWLVGIQTAALGLLSFIAEKQGFLPFDKKWLRRAIISFVLSILVSSWTLSALPEMVQRIKDSSSSIHEMTMFRHFPVPLWVFTSAQHWLFILGLVFFAFAVIKKLDQ
jgi:hypothetical protein